MKGMFSIPCLSGNWIVSMINPLIHLEWKFPLIFHLFYLPLYPPFTQCAAVRTSWELIRLPPQKGLEDLEDRRPTIQGYSLALALTPSTILDTVLAWPHLHEEPWAAAGDGVDADRSSQTLARRRLITRLCSQSTKSRYI